MSALAYAMLTESQVWELWCGVSQFVCPSHPDGGCEPQICLNCRTCRCSAAGDCDCGEGR
jgi:hypothetical protein